MRALLDLVFPVNCAGCDRPGVPLCDLCLSRVPHIDPATACPACGAPNVGPCRECGGRRFAFTEARCAALLEPPVSRAVVLLKDACERRYAVPLADLLAGAAAGWLAEGDVLVPVPASPAAVRRRGFDHALDIARALSARTHVPVMRALAARAGADQRALGREQRFENRLHAFTLAAVRELPSRVVLLDDVLTTGATLDAAARVLLAAGVEQVRALAVARSCSGRPRE